MTNTKISEREAVLLVRALGLLVNQASIYGAAHNVTRSAARSVFIELEKAVRQYGSVEFAVREGCLFVNDSSDGLDAVTVRNLHDKMERHQLGGIIFTNPLVLEEFIFCVTLFATAPVKLVEEGGFEAAIKRANLKSIQTVTVTYQRVLNNETLEPTPKASGSLKDVAHAHRQPNISSTTGILDLSAALEGVDADATASVRDSVLNDGAEEKRKKRAVILASLLREVALVLESESSICEVVQVQHHQLDATLKQARCMLDEITEVSEQQITVLANQVDNDRHAIASIESAARRRGISLKLTRRELVERYAELNQEIVQPLTVSTGVIDMLNSGHGGSLTEAQRDMLKLAAESVERVNQLVAYMSRIAGLPDSYTPDIGVITDTYQRT